MEQWTVARPFKLLDCWTVMNLLPHLPAEHRLRQIGLARRAVMVEGRRPGEVRLDSGEFGWIEHSWRRCLANGQRPDQRVAFDVIHAQAARRIEEANHALLVYQWEP